MSMFSVGDKFRAQSNNTGMIESVNCTYDSSGVDIEYMARWDHTPTKAYSYKEKDIKDNWVLVSSLNNGQVTLPAGADLRGKITISNISDRQVESTKLSCSHDWRSSSAVKGKTKWCAICDERE